MFDKEYLISLVLSAVAVLVALTFHEFAHGYAAYKLGDKTAYNMGRLTLNPIKHLDPLGAICMVFFHFGWARPVPINLRNFKKPRRDCALTALAGPITNMLIGLLFALLTQLSFLVYWKYGNVVDNTFLHNLTYYTFNFIVIFHTINVGLGIFNLLPIPPFDGSRILFAILPQKLYFKVMMHERQIYWFVVGWLLLGGFLYRGVMSVPLVASNPVLSGFARIFSLSQLISDATRFISQAMLNLWGMLPLFNSIPKLIV